MVQSFSESLAEFDTGNRRFNRRASVHCADMFDTVIKSRWMISESHKSMSLVDKILECGSWPKPTQPTATARAPRALAFVPPLINRSSRLRRQTVGRNPARWGAEPLPRERSWQAAAVQADRLSEGAVPAPMRSYFPGAPAD